MKKVLHLFRSFIDSSIHCTITVQFTDESSFQVLSIQMVTVCWYAIKKTKYVKWNNSKSFFLQIFGLTKHTFTLKKIFSFLFVTFYLLFMILQTRCQHSNSNWRATYWIRFLVVSVSLKLICAELNFSRKDQVK